MACTSTTVQSEQIISLRAFLGSYSIIHLLNNNSVNIYSRRMSVLNNLQLILLSEQILKEVVYYMQYDCHNIVYIQYPTEILGASFWASLCFVVLWHTLSVSLLGSSLLGHTTWQPLLPSRRGISGWLTWLGPPFPSAVCSYTWNISSAYSSLGVCQKLSQDPWCIPGLWL